MTGTDVVVLGAGPAGVGAAYRAARAGHRVVVLEREQHVGGVAASFDLAGVRVDHGSHRLHQSIEPEILAVLDRLLGDDLQVRPRRGRIRLAGRWIGFPLTPAGVTALPPGFALRASIDTVTSPMRSPTRDTFDEVVRAGLGPTMADRFYGPYAEKLWGLPPEDLAGDQARTRIPSSTPTQLVRRVVRGADPAARTFRYPRRGFGQLWEALADAAVDAGADIRLGTPVTAIRGGGEVDTDRGPVRAGTVLSTIPLPVLARLHTGAPPAVVAAARELGTRAMVLVYLVLDVPRYTRYDAHYLPEAWTPVTRVSEPKNYRDSTDDPSDRTVLCAELPCQVGDAAWTADDAALGDLVVEALARADLPQVHVREVVTRRLPSAYPVYRVGYEAPLGVLDRWASGLSDVLTFGRQGLFVHDNSHHALAMAWAAVDAIGPDGIDRAAWRRDRERFATHVVED